MRNKTLSIIIISFNTKHILKECLNRVRSYSKGIDIETIVVDNASSDGSPAMVQEAFPEVKLIVSAKNLGFAGGNNLGIKRASGRYLLLLNSDAYLLPDVLTPTLEFMKKTPACGILGVKLIGEDGARQPCARMLPTPWLKFLIISGIAAKCPGSKIFGGADYGWWSHDTPKEVGWVPGAYFLIRRETLDTIGLLDERYFLYFEETDYCLRAKRAGWKVMIYPYARVVHLGGESSKTTNKQITSTGKQLLQYKLQSEFLYYRKNFGLGKVLAASSVEILWNVMVLIKNSIQSGKRSRQKIEQRKMLNREIIKTLVSDNFGTGKKEPV